MNGTLVLALCGALNMFAAITTTWETPLLGIVFAIVGAAFLIIAGKPKEWND